MIKINLDLLKRLRLKSGSGILDCKEALFHSKGDIDKAIIILKKKGHIKAAKKINNSAIRGVINTYIKNNHAYILELNSETDFVEKHIDFIKFSQKILYIIHNMKITQLDVLNKILKEEKTLLISKFNENIVIRRFCILAGNFFTSYIHRNRIGVLVESNCENTQIVKQIAMHIAANNPDYLTRDHIPKEIITKEKKIQLEIAISEKKPLSVAEKIVSGRLEKFIQNICLLEQNCIFDLKTKIKDFLFKNNVHILKFVRYELGEEI